MQSEKVNGTLWGLVVERLSVFPEDCVALRSRAEEGMQDRQREERREGRGEKDRQD